jgi:Predicted transcriptional regulator
MSQQTLIAYKDLAAKGIDASMVTLWRWENAGKFPKRVTISHTKIAWIEGEVNAWLADRIAARQPVAA